MHNDRRVKVVRRPYLCCPRARDSYPGSAALRGPHGVEVRGGAHERPELVHDVEPAGEGRHARDAGARVRLQHLAGPRIGNAVMENAPKANGHC